MIQENTLAGPERPKPLNRRQRSLLLIAAAVSSSCGLAVELLLGTLASYLVGNQALAYGVAVGGFLAAMGVGAYLSQFIARSSSSLIGQQQQLQFAFVAIELLIAPLSAILPLALFALFVISGPFWLGLFLVTLILGGLAGLEVPLLTRILVSEEEVGDALAGVLALDYLGALVGSLAFPVILLPLIGLFPSAAIIGALPALMVFGLGRAFPNLRRWSYWGLGVGVALCVLAPMTIPIGDRLENSLYKAPIISRIQSAYQRIVLTRRGSDVRLFLDGDLQLSTLDEYRYHEALVHPALSANLNLNSKNLNSKTDSKVSSQISSDSSFEISDDSGVKLISNLISEVDSGPPKSETKPQRHVLIMGAGDGMALREVLKWPDVEHVVLVDLDQAVVNLARRHPTLRQANQNAFQDPRVELRIGDAFTLVPSLSETFDVIIADFPDPDRDIIAKLYAQGFYQRLLPRLAPQGVFVTQASSPFFAPRAFACVAATLASVGLSVHPYVVDVPSFGPWGFVLAARSPIDHDRLTLPIATRFLTAATLPTLFQLPGDIRLGHVKINRLAQPVIVRYQEDPRWEGYE
jgi:spermidine synthase